MPLDYATTRTPGFPWPPHGAADRRLPPQLTGAEALSLFKKNNGYSSTVVFLRRQTHIRTQTHTTTLTKAFEAWKKENSEANP